VREGRVIALAGLFQAISLVRTLAQRGSCDGSAMRACLASVLRIDAESPAAVYAGIGNLRLGLECLVGQLDGRGQRDLAITRMAVTVMRLERALAKHPDHLDALGESIRELAPLLGQTEAEPDEICARLARVYCNCLSPLKPRVMVEGNPEILSQPAHVNRIRALLLAAIRAAVLWRQLGGGQWRLLFRHRQYAMLARGLLTRCTLDGA